MAKFEDQLQTSSTNFKESANWFGDSVKNIFSKNRLQTTSLPEIGKMYLFVYDPKLKDILPFYDMYPLSIPINYYNDGFLGLNLHYLPPLARGELLNALISVENSNKTDNIKLSITYDILRSSSIRFPGYKQCVKRYLYGYVRSSFGTIESNDWNKVVLLPLQKWSINSNKKYSEMPPY